MQPHRDLKVYAQALELVKELYSVTAAFPPDERFGLTSQLRRAAISIGSNIAEGCARSSSRELHQFLAVALGSAREVEFQLTAAAAVGLVAADVAGPAVSRSCAIQRMLIALMMRVRPTAGRAGS